MPDDWDLSDSKLNWIAARTEKDAEIEAEKRLKTKYGDKASTIKYILKQDDDVLDTWFSSGLFPFSTMGWPDNTDDFESFYPGDLLETGGDIIFFWVARMVMMSLALENKLPFHTVYLHPMVRDEHGAKMSKSSGNVIDPLHIINGVSLDILIKELHSGNIREDKITKFEKQKRLKFPDGIPPCGADALRYGLSSLLVQRSINLNVNTVIGKRMFCNKIWQATKLALGYFGDANDDEKSKETHIDYDYLSNFLDNNPEVTISDRWILSKLNRCIVTAEENNQKYEFGITAITIHQFFIKEFCAIYLESIKPLMYDENGNDKNKKIVRDILYIVLRETYKMMHPFMPFLTEELFQRIKKARYGNGYNFGDETIIIAPYPDRCIPSWDNPKIEKGRQLAIDLSQSILSIKQSRLGIATKQQYNVYLKTDNDENRKLIELMKDDINTGARCQSIQLFDDIKQNENDYFKSSFDVYEEKEVIRSSSTDEDDKIYTTKEIVDTIFIYSDVKGLVNIKARLNKFNKEIEKLNKLIEKNNKALSRIEKEDIRKKTEDKIKGYQENLDIFRDAVDQLQRLAN